MNIDYKTIIISVVLSVIFSLAVVKVAPTLGLATILSTDSSDTLETFRTNVNTSLTNLRDQALATTTANSWTATQSFSRIGVSSTTPLGNIGIGTGTATSSVSRGFYCDVAKDEAGRLMFIKLSTSGNTVFSTSTTSCL